MRSVYFCSFLLLFLFASGCANFSVERQANRVLVRSARVEAVFEDGQIVSCRSRQQGTEFAAPGNEAGVIPIGLGCAIGQYEELRTLHVPWGSVDLNQHVNVQKLNIYLRPQAQSQFTLDREGKQWRLTWQGLGNDKEFFPECKLSIVVGSDEYGALTWYAEGQAPQGGIFGIQTPLNNISSEVRFVLPHFGGMEFRHSSREALCPYGGAPFWEAPVTAIEKDGMALGVWLHNPEFQPYYAYFKNGPSGFAFSFEPNSLMPIENKIEFRTPLQKLDIFPGDWKDAMRPFRNWYQKEFAREIARRDSLDWAENIKLVIDMGTNFEKVAAEFDPTTVMFHNWNARAAKFDTELPDWTPRAGFVESVEKMHSYGFKSMAYVNTYCINYQSPVFQRDNLENIFLTRKNSLWRYNEEVAKSSQPSALSDMLIGTVDQAKGTDQFEGIKPGRLLYGDPLSEAWRVYHAKSMQVWNTSTGSDANYEDTAGCVNDHGNGIVDGLSAGQGSVAQMRLLQETQPGVPMASEYGPEGIAFAVKWPLNYAQVWGNIDFRRRRIHRQLPVTTYLYGYTTWIPYINCGNDFTRHLISACSDALGGMGMLSSNFADADSGGMPAHLTHRAKLFTQKKLKPYFPEHPYPEFIRCYYQGLDGIYQYYDDGKLQKMLSPDGEELYARIDNASSYEGKLTLPGWPLSNEKCVFGLNPALSYAFFPKSPKGGEILQIESLPEHVCLQRYFTGPGFVYLELRDIDNKPSELILELLFKEEFDELYLNGKKFEFSRQKRCSASLPLRLLACNRPASIAYDQPIADDESLVYNIGPMGICEGQAQSLKSLPNRRNLAGQPAYFVNYYQDKQMNWPLLVPDADAALRFRFKNYSDRASIVKIFLNGELVHSYDCLRPNPEYDPNKKNAKKIFNTALQERVLPLGKFAGQTVLVSLAVDHKSDSNSDNQSVCIPVLIKHPSQEWQERELP